MGPQVRLGTYAPAELSPGSRQSPSSAPVEKMSLRHTKADLYRLACPEGDRWRDSGRQQVGPDPNLRLDFITKVLDQIDRSRNRFTCRRLHLVLGRYQSVLGADSQDNLLAGVAFDPLGLSSLQAKQKAVAGGVARPRF